MSIQNSNLIDVCIWGGESEMYAKNYWTVRRVASIMANWTMYLFVFKVCIFRFFLIWNICHFNSEKSIYTVY